MIQEHSFGIIPLRFVEGRWEMLLICHVAGHWAFPKGHPEKDEAPKETAVRELKEETDLSVVEFFASMPLEEHYTFQRGESIVEKTVTYFLAKVSGTLMLQSEELTEGVWLTAEKAMKRATFPEAKQLIARVATCLQE